MKVGIVIWTAGACLLSFSLGFTLGMRHIEAAPPSFHSSIFITDQGTVCWSGDKVWISPTPQICEMRDAPK